MRNDPYVFVCFSQTKFSQHDYIATIDYKDCYARTQKQSVSGGAHFCKDYIETVDYTDYYARTQKQSISGEAQTLEMCTRLPIGKHTRSSAPAQHCTHPCQMVSTPAQVRPLSTVSMPAKW